MWSDNETDIDYLNFGAVAETAAQIILRAEGKPVSIGVSGAWGVGKSSMIRLIRRSLESQPEGRDEKFVYVTFNAWLYQGYDDARAAMIEVIVDALREAAKENTTAAEKLKDILKRVDWLRLTSIGASSAIALSLGLPPPGLVGQVFSMAKRVVGGATPDEAMIAEGTDIARQAVGNAPSLIKPAEINSPPKEIQALRDSFKTALEELGVTLVVLIDDLDRCLPETAISTLEAMRLFLFMERTAFVIAADEEMIRHAVRKHFGGVDESLVTSYFDKLIQIPIKVPKLGIHEVRAYLFLLYVENSSLVEKEKEEIRTAICKQLQCSWQGHTVDLAFVRTLRQEWPTALTVQFEIAERVAIVMATAGQIAGNPRLVKRFLNALAIRMAIAKIHGVEVDEAVLTKLLLLERCGTSAGYSEILRAASQSTEGKPVFLSELEDAVRTGSASELKDEWNTAFYKDWLALPPTLGDKDLRGALYVSRDNSPLISAGDRLTIQGGQVLQALLDNPKVASALQQRITALPEGDTGIIIGTLIERAKAEQQWGTPDILDAILAVVRADATQVNRIAAFLSERPAAQIQPSIVQKIQREGWSAQVFDKWLTLDISQPVRKAIEKVRK